MMMLFIISSIPVFSYSQTVTPNPLNPQNAEVGLANYYTFNVNLPNGATVSKWKFSSDSDFCLTGYPAGYINNLNNSTYTYGTTDTSFTVLATWGDCCFTTKTVKLNAEVTYYVKDNNGNPVYSTVNGSQTVNLYRIPCNISILGPNTAPVCCPTTLTYTVGDTGDADKFQWTVSGNAQILSGANTKTITVNPNTGDFTITFKAWRNSGHIAYVRTIQKMITRTNLSASLSMPIYNGNPQTFICKGTGLNATLTVDSGGCPNPIITWNTPNCTITSLGNNLYKIIPDNALAVGSFLHISATVQVNSCQVTTPVVDLKVLDSQAPTIPNGYLYYTYNGDFCTADILEIFFHDYNFVNGESVVTPDFMFGPGDPIHYNPSKTLKFTVCNKNLCTNASSCKIYYINPPAPCADPNAKQSNLLVYPNPITTETTLENLTLENGSFYIYNQNGLLMVSGDIASKQKVKINTEKLKNGQYTVYLKTSTANSAKQIIINK